MSSSSRSLAAARAKRAGEITPTISGTRPRTSVNSNAAFSQQQSYPPTNNVRNAKNVNQQPIQLQRQYQQQVSQNTNN